MKFFFPAAALLCSAALAAPAANAPGSSPDPVPVPAPVPAKEKTPASPNLGPPAPSSSSGSSPAPAPAPAPTPTPAAPAKPAIKHLGGPRYELNGISFNEETRIITLPALINMRSGLIEYALVEESGKVHESFLSTKISPYDLNVVLLLLNYQPSSTFFDLSNKQTGAMLVKNPKIAASSQLLVSLDWKNAEGQPQTARLDSLLLNVDKKATITPGPFTYTGSMLMDDGTFMAKETGSIIAMYADAAALFNNPREGNENDDNWLPDKSKTPPQDTPVTVTFSPMPK